MAQLSERLRLNLAHAFTRHAENTADLLQRVDTVIVQSEAQTNHKRFTVSEHLQNLVDFFTKHGMKDDFLGGGRMRIRYKIAETGFLSLTDGRFERNRLLRRVILRVLPDSVKCLSAERTSSKAGSGAVIGCYCST